MKFSFVSFVVGASIATGIAELMKPEHQTLRRSVKSYLAKPFQKETIKDFELCEIPLVADVPQDAVVIVGHAYSTTSLPNDFLRKNLKAFIAENRDKIEHVVFSGDVFLVPSQRRWVWLKDFFRKHDIEFSVAPGNHDVDQGDNTLRDIFDALIGDTHMRIHEFKDFIVVIEDSTKSDWVVTDAVIETARKLSQENPTKETVIVRHHIPVAELERLANSGANKSDNLANARDLSAKFADTKLSMISGDSGVSQRLPRSSCQRFGNLTFYANGLGGFADDEILMLHDASIIKIRLNP